MCANYVHSRAYPGPTRSSRHGPVALCPGNLGCRLGHPAELKGHCPSLLHRLALPRVRRDASRLHHSVGIQRGCLCSGDASWLPLRSQGYITATSARPHTVLYAVPFLQTKRGCLTGTSPDGGMHRGCLRCFRDRISYKIPPYWRKRSVQVQHHKEPSANHIL